MITIDAQLASAQMEQSGSITGIVADASGAAIKGASVSVTNTQTGVIREGEANGEGIYSI
jgi:hypothetical protein